MKQPDFKVLFGRAKDFLKKSLALLNPKPAVGGLHVTDLALYFAVIKEGELVKASLRLPPGILAGGEIKDRASFIAALRALRGQVAPPKKPVYVVAVLPASIVYTQAFAVPALEGARLEEAVRLNLEMLSPIDPSRAVFGYQVLGEKAGETNQLELLGAFAEAERVNSFLGAFGEAGFVVTAAELPALSLTRVIAESENIPDADAHLVVSVAADGMEFSVFRNRALLFARFTSWQAAVLEFNGHALSAADFKEFLAREIEQVLNFYANRWGTSLNKAVIVGEQMREEIAGAIKERFFLEIEPIAMAKYGDLESRFWPAAGAAIRGLLPRPDDAFLTLTPAGVQTAYWNERALMFARLWQKALLISFAFVFAVAVAADSYLARVEQRARTTPVVKPAEFEEVTRLTAAAAEFNRRVALGAAARDEITDWLPLFGRLKQLAGGTVIFRELSVQKEQVTVSAAAPSQVAALNFKNKLALEKNFEGVDLPLASLTENADRTVSFSMTFKVKSLKFE